MKLHRNSFQHFVEEGYAMLPFKANRNADGHRAWHTSPTWGDYFHVPRSPGEKEEDSCNSSMSESAREFVNAQKNVELELLYKTLSLVF